MIARYLIFFILLIVLPDIYIYLRYLHKRFAQKRHFTFLWWVPSAFLLTYMACLWGEKDAAPANTSILYWFLFLLGLISVPKAAFALCSSIGWMWCRWLKKKRNAGNLIGIVMALFSIYALVYGSTAGFRQMEVRNTTIRHADLPTAFEGYKIVLFSDVHAGSYSGERQKILAQAIKLINAQHADAIVFTGDLQNMRPQELYEHRHLLSSLHAKDGVFSVLGNHDYADYIEADSIVEAANIAEMCRLQRQFGWKLLNNEHRIVRRGNDSIVIAGMENDGEKPEYAKGDVAKTLRGTGKNAFVVMLQHDPSSWRRKILPQSQAQLTLSGHTHGGQFSVFGLSPARFRYSESSGLYEQGGRYIYVTNGLGGMIPFRFGVPGEIVVITLQSSAKTN